MEDIGEYKWNSLQVDILPESDTDSSYTVSNDILEKSYSDKTKLFKATYTGNYYLRFECSEGAKYSFMIETFDPFGYHVKDSSSNEYMILGNRTLEFVKAASKNIESYDFIWSETFKSINGLEVINSYDAGFTVTSIGEYAFKGCNLKSVSFSESINYIGVGAFQDCKKLGTEKWIMGVVIGGKNVTIENDAFKGCKKLGSVRVLKGASIESVGKNSFKNTKKGIRFEVPNVKKYKRIFKKSGIKKAKFSKSYI